jgi:hypothetical protein
VLTLLVRDLEAGGAPDPDWRAAEGLYGWVLDHPELDLSEVAAAVKVAADLPATAGAARAAARLLAESGPREDGVRERASERHGEHHPSALQLARAGDAEGLARLPARALRIGLQAATPPEASHLIAAWNALPVYDRERA